LERNKESILKVSDLQVSYGQIRALKGINLEVNEAELVALIGTNGAGKSTLLKAILGVEKVNNGKIEFMGQEITRLSTAKIVTGGISMVEEGRGILAPMTVKQNLQIGAYSRRVSKAITDHDMNLIMERFPILANRKNQLAGTLSGGEQQMLAIGRALMSMPKMIMLDEPSLGLAPLVINEVFHIITELRQGGTTILLAEQNARKSLQHADVAYVIETGLITLQGPAAELANNEMVKKIYLGGD
jgi:branched-chain amino acid transport system ATP-binding protein